MSDLAKEVTEFLKGERSPFHYSAEALAYFVWDTSLHNAAWGPATLREWEKAIVEAIERGLIVERNNKLGFPDPVAKPVTEQQLLF